MAEDRTAASPSRDALRRIRELEAINAQITRHRDRLAVALTYYADGRYPDGGEIAREALGVGGLSCEELGYHVCGGMTHG